MRICWTNILNCIFRYWLIIHLLNLCLSLNRLWLSVLCCLSKHTAIIHRIVCLLYLWCGWTTDYWVIEYEQLRLPCFFNIWGNSIWTTWKCIRQNVNVKLIICSAHIETILLGWTCNFICLNWKLKCVYIHYENYNSCPSWNLWNW